MESTDFFINRSELTKEQSQLLARAYRYILARAREKEKIKHAQKGKGQEWVSTPGQDAGTNAVSAGKFTA